MAANTNDSPFDDLLSQRPRQCAPSRVEYLTIQVDYCKSVEEIVARAYDLTDPTDATRITSKNFPTQRSGTHEVTIALIHLNRWVGVSTARAELDKMGFRPAELHELLALGHQHPNTHREFYVVALGSVWCDQHGARLFPSLATASDRSVHLSCDELACDDSARFAAVRK